MKHVGKDEIIPVHGPTGYFFLNVNAPYGMTYYTEL
jgi:hypothetical protein